MKKALIISAILIVLVGIASFYGGMKYQESKMPKGFTARNFQNLQNANGFNEQRGGNFLNGEIISKDDKSITIKLRDGGSKIIFLSSSTEISKTDSGSSSDLEVGKQITVSGQQNSDGSYSAQTIQIRQLSQPNSKNF